MPIGGRKQSVERATDALQASKDARKEISQLRGRVEHLKHVTRAMWSILSERVGVTQAELSAEVEKLEAAEREPAVAEKCVKCSRTLQQGSGFCIYCGAEVQKKDLF
jgi:hypothetical protein